MDNIQEILAAVQPYIGPLEATAVAVATALLIVLLFVIIGLRRELRARLQAHDRMLAEVRDDLGDEIAHSRQQVQETINAGLMRLQDVLDQRMAGLQRQMIEDAAGLKADVAQRFDAQHRVVAATLADDRLAMQRAVADLKASIDATLGAHRERMEQASRLALKEQQVALSNGMSAMSTQVSAAFRLSSDELGKRVEGLTRTTEARLDTISGQVEKRLSDGFEKTTETFVRVLEHLSRIDEAQKRITELSSNVVSLQEVLTDKRSRGAFGEVQLAALIRNIMPDGSYALQQTLSNGTRVDCLLTLPPPTGDVPIDAKFPLESFQRMMDADLPETDRARASRQFRSDIRKHIRDIADKYLIPGETADGAVMFLPAEAIFAEIHAHYPELVDEAQRARVWLVSPTTLMAVLTTARAVLKDDATRKQVHIIQDHLRRLADDFGRFQQRMDRLAQHIRQAHDDVSKVNTSAKKITSRFRDIDAVDLPAAQREDASDGLDSRTVLSTDAR